MRSNGGMMINRGKLRNSMKISLLPAYHKNHMKLQHGEKQVPQLTALPLEFPWLEFFLRPTVSRPVRLGIGPPFGTLDQILSCSSSFV
jgi:hypothetical protein